MGLVFNLESYLTNGVENIVKSALKATAKNPKESIFMVQYAAQSKKAAKKRRLAEESGEHIPPFLIASITSSCNLHCAGCYARANQACHDEKPVDQLTKDEWKRIFLEAKEMGIGFILLAGGEPMLRTDVIKVAGDIPEILFSVFTNGTLFSAEYRKIFDANRNLVPIISLEGHADSTDERRGVGTYEAVQKAFVDLKKDGILFGTSITVTTENIKEVTSADFIKGLQESGCKVVVFVEYVPVSESVSDLALNDEGREELLARVNEIRTKKDDMVIVSFPGDEKTSGGCLAAGRGFFHINSQGGAEPCPFSPFSDCNVKDTSLREVLHSKLFTSLQEDGTLLEDHNGGCVLFQKKEHVMQLQNK